MVNATGKLTIGPDYPAVILSTTACDLHHCSTFGMAIAYTQAFYPWEVRYVFELAVYPGPKL